MKRWIFAVVVAVLAGTALAAAESGTRSDGRYIVSEIENGILRVDRETGLVSVCRESRRDWQCELVPDDRQSLETEIDQLRKENRRLRRRLTDLDPQGAERHGYSRQPDRNTQDDSGIMTKQEVDQAMDTLEYMMNRFMGAAGQLRGNAPPPQ